MRATLNRDTILEALQKVQNVVGSKTTLPILLNTLVEAGDDIQGLRFTSTDMDISVRATADATVEEPGRAALPAKRLFQIFREMPGPEISFSVDENRATTIEAGKIRFVLMGMPADEFPAFPDAGDGVDITVPQAQLAEMLRRTSYAASGDETRQALNGLLLKLAEGRMTVVATDGRRLALAHAPLEDAGDREFEAVVPSKAVREIERTLDGKGEVKITVAASQAVFGFCAEEQTEPHTVLVTRLIDSTFPNYDQVIPSESKVKVTVPREQLLESLRRVGLLASEKSSAVRMLFEKKTLTISANTPEVGEAEESLDVEFSGERVEIGFNPGYLMDPLRNLESDSVALELTDELSPGVLRATEPFLYVLMPMRLN